MASSDNEQAALQWQVGVWDRMSPIYLREVDDRFRGVWKLAPRFAEIAAMPQWS